MFNNEMTFNFSHVSGDTRYLVTDGGALAFNRHDMEIIVQVSRLKSGVWQIMLTERKPGERFVSMFADAPNPAKAAEVLNGMLRERGILNSNGGRRKPPPRET